MNIYASKSYPIHEQNPVPENQQPQIICDNWNKREIMGIMYSNRKSSLGWVCYINQDFTYNFYEYSFIIVMKVQYDKQYL